MFDYSDLKQKKIFLDDGFKSNIQRMFVKELTTDANLMIDSKPNLAGAKIVFENNTADVVWIHDDDLKPDQVSTKVVR